MRNEDYVYVHCDFIVATRDAILIAQNNKEHWIPRSCLAWNADRRIEEFKKHDRVTIGVKQWLAEQKELEYD